MRKTFAAFLAERGERPHGWQKKAADALLSEMFAYRDGATGKTWLMRRLNEFIGDNGNDFELEGIQTPENSRQFVERMTKHADDFRQTAVRDIDDIVKNISMPGKKARRRRAALEAIHTLMKLRSLVNWYAEHLDGDMPF